MVEFRQSLPYLITNFILKKQGHSILGLGFDYFVNFLTFEIPIWSSSYFTEKDDYFLPVAATLHIKLQYIINLQGLGDDHV